MKRMTKIGLLVWVLLLTIPINIAAANQRLTFANFSGRVQPAITNNLGNHVVPLETGGDATSNSDSKTDNNNNTVSANQNDTQKSNSPATDDNNKPVTKQATETTKGVEPVKSSKETKESTTVPVGKSAAEGPVQSATPEMSQNKLQLENILLSISSWWLANPLNLQIWYLFCLIGLALYIFKLRQFRRPVLFLSIIILGFYLESSIDPIGAIFNIVPKSGFTFDVALFILGIAIFISLFLGRFYCGWICPLGAVQELIHPGTKAQMPSAMDALLKYLKYLVLLSFLYLAWRTGNNLWSDYEPLKVLIHFKGTGLALLVLIVTLIVSVLIERPFCRYVCPMGAILALSSRLALFKMRTDAVACMVCGKCTSGDCSMNAIESHNTITDLPEINSSECIYCLRCQKICQRSALRISAQRIDKMSNL
jgi:Fe-S-cluster-containing hydrogenase component 2